MLSEKPLLSEKGLHQATELARLPGMALEEANGTWLHAKARLVRSNQPGSFEKFVHRRQETLGDGSPLLIPAEPEAQCVEAGDARPDPDHIARLVQIIVGIDDAA